MDVQKLEAANSVLAKEVENFAGRVPPTATMGLGRLEGVVQRFDYLSPDAAYTILDPDSFEQEVERIHERGLPLLLVLRNLSSIAPLLATWITLFLAGNAYTSYINTHQGQPGNQTSFFVLWQNGFDGRVYSFTVAALIDVVLLAIFLMLTFWVQQREQMAETRTHAFARELQLVTTKLVGFIAERGGIALPPGANVQTVAEAVNRACAQAIQASRQIADDARKHIDDAEKRVDALVTQLSQRLGDLHTQMQGLATSANNLGSSASTLASGANSLAGSAGQYIQAGQAIQQHLSTLSQTESQLSKHLDTIGTSVSSAVTTFSNAVQSVGTVSAKIDQEMTQGVKAMTATITQAAHNLANADRSLQQTEQALDATSQELGRSGKVIGNAASDFEQALRVAGYTQSQRRGGSVLDWIFGRRGRSARRGRNP